MKGDGVFNQKAEEATTSTVSLGDKFTLNPLRPLYPSIFLLSPGYSTNTRGMTTTYFWI